MSTATLFRVGNRAFHILERPSYPAHVYNAYGTMRSAHDNPTILFASIRLHVSSAYDVYDDAPCHRLLDRVVLIPQGGTDHDDWVEAAVMEEDGSIILAGYTRGDWYGTHLGNYDFAAVKLDTNGTLLWKWQVR